MHDAILKHTDHVQSMHVGTPSYRLLQLAYAVLAAYIPPEFYQSLATVALQLADRLSMVCCSRLQPLRYCITCGTLHYAPIFVVGHDYLATVVR
jgi:hypothetical protein